MVDKNVLVAKIATIEKSLKKVKEKCTPTFEAFEDDEDEEIRDIHDKFCQGENGDFP